MNFLKFANNLFAILIFASLVGVSALATIALSPVGIGAEQSRVAGLNEGSIVSNPLPLKFEDVAAQLPNFKSQLVLLQPTLYSYNIEVEDLDAQEYKIPILLVSNPNSTGIKISTSAQVASEISQILSVNLSDGVNSYRLHDSALGATKEAEFIIPTSSAQNLTLNLKLSQPLNFKGKVTVVVSY